MTNDSTQKNTDMNEKPEMVLGKKTPNSASQTKVFLIDAKGRRMGTLATEAAALLNGKNSVDFTKNLVANVTVKIVNASQMDISEKKRMQEEYQTYSGHPGGQKIETLQALATRRGYAEVLRRTISGMLPKNRLRDIRLKNLMISE